mgnify:FL=1
MVKKAPYRKGEYDEYLEKNIQHIKNILHKEEDDRLFLIIGETGAGKSHLGLHIMEQYLGEKAHVDLIGFNKSTIAEGLKKAKDMELPRLFFADEANISKRDSQTRFNKQIIDLYFAIRGLQIFHIWCNPSLDMLDKPFIEERISGIFYVIKNKNTPNYRLYYYFRKSDILAIYNKYGNLKLPLMYKVRKKYAYYRGWSKQYKGFLFNDYEKKKEYRMDEKIEEFFSSWSKEPNLLTPREMANKLNVSMDSIRKYADTLKEREILVEGENFFTAATGRLRYKPELIEKFIEVCKENQARGSNWKNVNKKGTV